VENRECAAGEFADRDLGNKRDVSWLLSPTVPSVRPDLSRDFRSFHILRMPPDLPYSSRETACV
jgi:hypothetical protein